MPFNLRNLFQGHPNSPQQVTAGGGGFRDEYLQHIQDMALAGKPALSWEDWIRQRQMQAQQMQQLPQSQQITPQLPPENFQF